VRRFVTRKLKLREKMINVKRIRKIPQPKEGNSDRKVEQLRTIR